MFITYNGLLDPLGSSQILPYVELLHRDRPMHVLSFERSERVRDAAVLGALTRRLEGLGIGWTRLTYHRRFSVLAKTWDVAAAVRSLRRVLQAAPIRVLHARGYVPMEMATRASHDARILFDIRGLQGEEYVEGGVWSRRDPRYWLLKRSEERFFRRADAAVVLTNAILPYVRGRFGALGRTPPIEVIPTCVDLDRFRYDAAARRAFRERLGVNDDMTVFVYSGSLGTWYMADEMARFVRVFGDRTGLPVFLLWQVNTSPELARAASERAGLWPGRSRIVRASADEVHLQLSAADVGLALIRPTFSKRASAPTKYGEYLAIGLPVVFSEGVGDSAALAERDLGVSVPAPHDAALAEAALRLRPLLGVSRERTRAAARELFGLEEVAAPGYRRIYDALER